MDKVIWFLNEAIITLHCTSIYCRLLLKILGINFLTCLDKKIIRSEMGKNVINQNTYGRRIDQSAVEERHAEQ